MRKYFLMTVLLFPLLIFLSSCERDRPEDNKKEETTYYEVEGEVMINGQLQSLKTVNGLRAAKGVIEGLGRYAANSTCNLSVRANPNYEFVGMFFRYGSAYSQTEFPTTAAKALKVKSKSFSVVGDIKVVAMFVGGIEYDKRGIEAMKTYNGDNSSAYELADNGDLKVSSKKSFIYFRVKETFKRYGEAAQVDRSWAADYEGNPNNAHIIPSEARASWLEDGTFFRAEVDADGDTYYVYKVSIDANTSSQARESYVEVVFKDETGNISVSKRIKIIQASSSGGSAGGDDDNVYVIPN